jgi:transcriptional regulator with XRE-family HTH domain
LGTPCIPEPRTVFGASPVVVPSTANSRPPSPISPARVLLDFRLAYTEDVLQADDYCAFRQALGKRIRAVRQAKHLSAGDCARAAGMASRHPWLRYERGRRLPNAQALWRIGVALNVPVDSLLPDTLASCRPATKLDPTKRRDLTPRERNLFRFLASHVDGFWDGAEFELHPVAALADGCKLTRVQVLWRVRRLEKRGILVYLKGDRYKLGGGMQTPRPRLQPEPRAAVAC